MLITEVTHCFRKLLSCRRIFSRTAILSLVGAPLFVALAGCHSYQVAITIENRTGVPAKLLEVDYPSASFGADALASGADFHYRIQIRGDGPVKVQYTDPSEHLVQLTGPALHDQQQGKLQIILLPGGKAQFLPQMTP